ncbi:jg9564 [Pararge aegeria aegeria]|uniref:Jg9564 protein n=1 Tax=Pararge aegeria aegeria TaxID=348720 RepID=A0A8S4RPV5_9NEOP|nr:jg9564 [Pararge aegeria aegeria]
MRRENYLVARMLHHIRNLSSAEKALFRALKTRSKTPKYGLLYHSTFIGRAGLKNKGRISRYLANKCSIASRIDCFSENQTTIYGEKLRQQVEDRLKFYETGDIPAKNIDVMKQAMEEVALMTQEEPPEETPKKKKKKKKNKQEGEAMEE